MIVLLVACLLLLSQAADPPLNMEVTTHTQLSERGSPARLIGSIHKDMPLSTCTRTSKQLIHVQRKVVVKFRVKPMRTPE